MDWRQKVSENINEEIFQEEEDDNDDVIELNPSDEKKKAKPKRKRISNVWAFFDLLPMVPGAKPRAKCKSCNSTYLAPGEYGTVAFKSTFSTDRYVVDQFRSSLKPEIVEALVCTRDWLYGEQEHTQMTLEASRRCYGNGNG